MSCTIFFLVGSLLSIGATAFEIKDKIQVYPSESNHLRLTILKPLPKEENPLDKISYVNLAADLLECRLKPENCSVLAVEAPLEGVTVSIDTEHPLEELERILSRIESIDNDRFTKEELLEAKKNIQKNYEEIGHPQLLESLERTFQSNADCFSSYFKGSEKIVDIGYGRESEEISKKSVLNLFEKTSLEGQASKVARDYFAERLESETDKEWNSYGFDSREETDFERNRRDDQERQESCDRQWLEWSCPCLDNTNQDYIDTTLSKGTGSPILVSNTTSNSSLNSLTLSDTDKKNIRFILKTLGKPSDSFFDSSKKVVKLMKQSDELHKAGDRVEHVHPLRFLAYILSTPSLKENLYNTLDSLFTKKQFISGFSRRMKEERARDGLFPYLQDFANQLGIVNFALLHSTLTNCHNDYERFLVYALKSSK